MCILADGPSAVGDECRRLTKSHRHYTRLSVVQALRPVGNNFSLNSVAAIRHEMPKTREKTRPDEPPIKSITCTHGRIHLSMWVRSTGNVLHCEWHSALTVRSSHLILKVETGETSPVGLHGQSYYSEVNSSL